jgi:HD-GYP domain-containing protein (c-di-GMP phosphodiesterase class II)
MLREMQIPVLQLVTSISSTTDLMSPLLANHHKLVAYIAFGIAKELGFSHKERKNILLAGALHDLGGLSLTDRVRVLDFEAKDPHRHAEVGYRLLKLLDPFDGIADIVRYHHVAWHHGKGCEHEGGKVPEHSHIIHLADRIAVLINQDADISEQAGSIVARVGEFSGTEFKPEHIEAFSELAGKEYFWLDIRHRLDASFLQRLVKDETVIFDNQGLARLTQFFAQMIDFRSPFTATHSTGVAASAVAIAEQMAFSEQECLTMQIAGYLHDLGKLAVPTEILEKPGKLTAGEWRIIKAHTYHGYRTLEQIADLKTINEWGSFHHERLDGKGYPFHLNRNCLSLGSRIMAVADIFTAITEDRPYRKGMNNSEVVKIIRKLCLDGALDANVVNTLEKNFADINYRRMIAQEASISDYKFFIGR